MGSTPIIGKTSLYVARCSAFKSVTDRLLRNEIAERSKAAEAKLCSAYDPTLTDKSKEALSALNPGDAQVQGAANSCPQSASRASEAKGMR
jgi:hypothetical protein